MTKLTLPPKSAPLPEPEPIRLVLPENKRIEQVEPGAPLRPGTYLVTTKGEQEFWQLQDDATSGKPAASIETSLAKLIQWCETWHRLEAMDPNGPLAQDIAEAKVLLSNSR